MRPLSPLLLVFLFSLRLFSQQSEAGVFLGTSTYQGDINKYGFKYSTADQNFLFGITYNYELHKSFYVGISLMHSKLSGSDSRSKEDARIKRNLSFRSPITELALLYEISPLKWWSKTEKYKLQPFFSGGLAVFKYKPMALYQGTWYNLQPLSTEGQGLPGSNMQPYNLINVSLPMGAGLCYQLNENMKILGQISSRRTFTDYLDDVSGNYYDLSEIKKYKGDIAAKLAYRTGEVMPDDELPPNLNAVGRGNPNKNDWYMISSISVRYIFGKPRKTKTELIPPLNNSPLPVNQ